MIRGFKYRLSPTPTQAEALGQWVGATRFVYNLALEQRRIWGRSHKIGWAAQSREVTTLREQTDWLAAVPRVCLEQAIRDLDKAFAAFFRGGGFPRGRSRGRHDACRFQGRDFRVRRLNAKWGAIHVPKIGELKFRMTRDVAGEATSATISQEAGAWFVSIAAGSEAMAISGLTAAVGIDRGVANTLALSTGEMLSLPDGAAVQKKIAKAAKVLARRRRGSRRYAAQRRRLGRLTARRARQRAEWLHKASTGLARRFGVVAIEDLKIKNMTRSAAGTVAKPGRGVAQKRGLNRSILTQGWGRFAAMLDYKLEAAGGRLLKCSPAFTSQTCAACGVIDAQSRKSQAVFECVHCGHRDNADVNAAKEILRRSTALMLVEGSHFGPDEARTRKAA